MELGSNGLPDQNFNLKHWPELTETSYSQYKHNNNALRRFALAPKREQSARGISTIESAESYHHGPFNVSLGLIEASLLYAAVLFLPPPCGLFHAFLV